MCSFSGNLTHDPELRTVTTGGGKQVSALNFTIACNSDTKDNNGNIRSDTLFLQCEAWDSSAELIARFFQKGSKIIVVGKMKNNEYTNGAGVEVKSMKLKTEKFHFAEKKAKGTQNHDEDYD